MKKFKSIIVFTLVLGIILGNFSITSNMQTSALSSNLEDEKYLENGIVYRMNSSDKTASVIEARNFNAHEIVIPEKVNGFEVTKIEKKAFGQPIPKKYKSIILPNTITVIEKEAFKTCLNLRHVKLPTNLKSIGSRSFTYCSSLKELELPNSVEFIGKETFFSCVSLEKINIPTSLRVLPKKLFAHCISLNGMYIHEHIEKIHHDVFDECGINLDLNKTVIDEKNPFYAKHDNFIIDKKTNSKLINFAILDEKYNQKRKIAQKLYDIMKNFLVKYKDCPKEEFDKECIKFIKNFSNSPQKLTKKEFEKKSKNKLLLYRGVIKKEYADDFKTGKIFFGENLKNERGNGIYTAPERKHAEFWIWSQNPDDYKIIEQYAYDYDLYEKMAYKLVPHGEVLTMFLNNEAKILDNTNLREFKDLICKMNPNHLKNVTTFRDETFSDDNVLNSKVFKTKEDLLFHNSGLLTKLLGYDVLYEKKTKAIIDENGKLGSEYLIINPEILNVLID